MVNILIKFVFQLMISFGTRVWISNDFEVIFNHLKIASNELELRSSFKL